VTEKDLKASGSQIQKAPKVANPLVKEQEYLRANLFSSMVMSLSSNQFMEESISLFEIGRGFEISKPGQLPEERECVAIGFIGGHAWPIKYKDQETYYKAKGIIERVLREFKLSDVFEFKPVKDGRFVDGTGAAILAKNIEIGRIGQVDDVIAGAYDLKKKAVVGELYLDLALSAISNDQTYKEIGKYPKTNRDISVIFSRDVRVADILRSLKGIDPLIRKIEIIDIYVGKPLEKEEKSISIRFSIMSLEKTLTDQEVEKVVMKCHNKLKELGGNIRSGSK
jgi:phenylalanyl-tRNA synthetase beta chain